MGGASQREPVEQVWPGGGAATDVLSLGSLPSPTLFWASSFFTYVRE